MKTNYFKAILLLVSLLTVSSSFSQSSYSDKFPKWRLGLNMGGTWQSNDLSKNKAGLAGGFNIERILNRKEEALVGFSLGFRFLSGNSYGLDNNRNIALKSNTVLNGTIDTTLNYFKSPGYFYNNYKTKHGEGAFELKMNFPKFEKRTNIVFHLWGGIGVATYSTKINALNGDTMYNFSNIASQPSIGNLQSFYDKSYETVADGSSASVASSWAPSCGFGLGYRFSKNVALVFEHKLTFPRVDVIDGQQWKDDNTRTGNNDFYHYTAAHLIFTIYGRAHSSSSTYNNTTNTNVNTQTNLNNSPKPIINIYTPITNPHTTTSNVQQVSGTIKYVTSSNGVSINVNGAPLYNFDFNPNNGSFGFNTNLNPGINNITITGTNSAGQDSETIQVNYSAPQFTNQPIVNELPPKVIINYPSNNYTSSLSNTNVNSVISNVSSSANIAISVNGVAISNFNYNSYSGVLGFVAPLNAGNNSIVVSAFNTAGNDAQQVFVKHTPTNVQTITPKAEPKPVVSFHNPSSSPFESAIKTFNVTAHVSNVTAANQIAVNYNGTSITNFTFNPYGFINFNVSLNVGSNFISITGTNNEGSDVKYAVINYKESGKPPVVTIIEPSQNPFVTNALNYSVVAKFDNVQNQSDVNVMLNGSLVPFTFNTANQTATIQTNLNPGKSTIIVSAANGYGSDSKTQIIERTLAIAKKPLVKIISPATSPFVSMAASQQVVAQVFNVSAASEIQVVGSANASIPFNYDVTNQQISFTASLVLGANVYTITATNTAGSDSKSVTINYSPKSTPILEKPPVIVFVNPSINPYSTFDLSMNVIATVVNVATQQGLVVKLNGAITNFTFNPISKEIIIPSNLVIGSNTIIVTASNIAGSDTKTQIIDRKEADRCLISPAVTIITPSVNPYNTTNALENVRAEVLNVTGASSIQVTNQQGQAVTFTYDNNSHYVDFVANLVAGNNVFSVKATNNVDAVTKSLTIFYTKTVTTIQTPIKVLKPVVDFVTPSQANTTIQVPAQAISATVANVKSASGISVQVNGQAFTTFTFVNDVVAFGLTCNEGNNTITVTGSNVSGSDSKTVFVNYEKPAPPLPLPVVTFVTPNALSTVTLNATQNVQASILNITNASQAEVKVNGAIVSNFTYSNGSVNFVANLNVGNNTIVVKGTNASGIDSKTISIILEKREPVIVVSPPVLNYVVPTSNSLTTSNASEAIRMTVTNITTTSQLSVKVNGISITNYTLTYGVINFSTNLNLGSNTVEVTATNTAGSDTKPIVITRLAPPAPLVTITSPSVSPFTSLTPSVTVNAMVANVASSSEINVSAGGVTIPFVYNAVTDMLSFSYMITGNTTFVIAASNADGSDSKSQVINYAPNGPKISICHYPNGLSGSNQTISILESDWPIYEALGATRGSCPDVVVPPVVNFIIPATASTTTQNPTQNITASVTNVTSPSQVSVLVNNVAVTNFNLVGGNVSFVSNLNIGANTVIVTATNSAGSDSKTANILFEKKEGAAIVLPPVLSYVVPINSVLTTINSSETVKMSVTNVSSSSQISVKLNGVSISNFTFNNGLITFTPSLNMGSNAIIFIATNNGGSDTKTVSITRQAPPAPTVTITSPGSNPYNSLTPIINVTASVANVNSSSEINVSMAGTTIPFTYDANSDVLNFTYMIPSNATFVISATNANGSDSKSVTINYAPNGPKISICHYPNGANNAGQTISVFESDWPIHAAHGDSKGACAAVVNPPFVSFIIPASVATTTQNSVQNITATVTNIISTSQVNVLLNNSAITNLTLVNGNVSFVGALTMGVNTIKVTATNTTGSDSKTITITRQAPPINNTPKTNKNTQPTNTTPKTTDPKANEPKKEEPKSTPRTIQPTSIPPAPVKTSTPSTVTEENNGGSAPRTIKPR